MRVEQKTNIRNSVSRLILSIFATLLQILWILLLLTVLNESYTIISAITGLSALIIVLVINSTKQNSSMKILWIILILELPVFGVAAYLLVGQSYNKTKILRKFKTIDDKLDDFVFQDKEILYELEVKNISFANQCKYIINYADYCLYKNSDVTYHKEATIGIEEQKNYLRKAEKFIFLEYHAIEDAQSFSEILEILKQKASDGVDVRILYDDIGSIGFLNKHFKEKLNSYGIKCRIFNIIKPFMSVFMNNRDHRKITVVDGRVAFTGGYNIADEYFNITHPYGYWKDTGIKVEGDAVTSFTKMFLEMWNYVKLSDQDYSIYFPRIEYKAKEYDSFVIPYADNPLDTERVSENIYLNMIKNAKHFVYITTPYLIITDDMCRELELASKRGVKIRIITPGIPDKKIIYKITRSFYSVLVQQGIEIYEYTPGFCHAKMCLCDNEIASVGTINFDFRSLYHHFENGCLIYNCLAINDIYNDFCNIFNECENVTSYYSDKRSKILTLSQYILRLFAPLL